jgi:hypothetical protein
MTFEKVYRPNFAEGLMVRRKDSITYLKIPLLQVAEIIFWNLNQVKYSIHKKEQSSFHSSTSA